MYLSITFVGLWYKNLSKCIESKYQEYKLLGSRVQLVVNNERLRVKYIIVSVFYDRSMCV